LKSLIITHPGSAHFDEFFAISLILAKMPDTDFIIERREPSESELNNPDIWVLDIGEQLNHDLKNLDHHQHIDLNASFVLVSKYFRIDKELETLPWWTFKDRIDRFGPSKAGEELGTTNLRVTYSPFEAWYLDFFASNPNDCLPIMRQFGINTIKKAKKMASQFKFWEKCKKVTIKNLVVFIGHTDDTEGAQDYNDKLEIPAAVFVTHDSRGAGWKLCRFDNYPEVDFSKLEGRKEIKFTHKTGFVAKTNERLSVEEVLELVSIAIPDV
jgi:hypothetical protein